MKNFIAALIMFCVFACSQSYAGDCANGSCSVNRFARKTVSVTRNVLRVPVVVGRNIVVTTRDVIRNQPIRNRVVNRSTVVVQE